MYCNVSDIENALTAKVVAQLSNDENPDVVNSVVVTKFIVETSELIDDYLRGRYELPLKSEHVILKRVCVGIVKHALFLRRGKVSEVVQGAYDEGLTILDKIQKGRITLDEGSADTRPSFFIVSERKHVFTFND